MSQEEEDLRPKKHQKAVIKKKLKKSSSKKGGGLKRKAAALLSPVSHAKRQKMEQQKKRKRDVADVEVNVGTLNRSAEQNLDDDAYDTIEEINKSLMVSEKEGDETVKQLSGTQVCTVLRRYGLYEDNGGGISEAPSNSGGLKSYRMHIDLVK